MIYNNLIYLLIVILIFSTSSPPDSPQLPFLYAILLFLLKLTCFHIIVRFLFRRVHFQRASHYFAAEQKSSILAIVFTAIDVYLLDCQYYFAKIPFAAELPSLVSLAGISLFFMYLAIIWLVSVRSYYYVFGRAYTKTSFLFNNLKTNLPIVLPWLILSLLSDLLQITSTPVLKDFLASPWGEPVIFLCFFIILAIGFPVLITRLWNCKPLPAGETRDRIETFCRQQNLGYAQIMTWPLFEGQMLTAGVMGLVKKFRYLLVTPALLKTMTPIEIEAVMAHEIGHVKKYHMQLYLLLFIGFGVLAQLSTYPFLYLLLSSNIFYDTARFLNKDPGAILNFMSTVPMFFAMIIYFRYIFGFFMRNFERQADLHVFQAMPSADPLIQVLEKIAYLSGNIRDLPSWHHFGIGERIDYLRQCMVSKNFIAKHNRKVKIALLVYILGVMSGIMLIWKMPDDLLDGAPREKYAEAVLLQKIEAEPENSLWYQLLGDLQHSRKLYRKSINAYETAIEFQPDNYDAINNLAWLLLTAEDKDLRDAVRALRLARKAAMLQPKGYILDTLATAYWYNDFADLARNTEQQAINIDPANTAYYREQIKKFQQPPP